MKVEQTSLPLFTVDFVNEHLSKQKEDYDELKINDIDFDAQYYIGFDSYLPDEYFSDSYYVRAVYVIEGALCFDVTSDSVVYRVVR